MSPALSALEFVEACKEFVAKYSTREAYRFTSELSILRESYAGWTLMEHPVGIDETIIYGSTHLSYLASRLFRL
jgi:hypothetical protein